ncbi:tail fiber assembly protein [Hafnia paralvei]|uniref:Tail fiber assembly protein n=1 Tax=Hafnia paralvei TaxID=546367 RepID=A0A4Q9ESD9_9GAMM|nr:tail fiber assembly protein [Hafnia paralvei]
MYLYSKKENAFYIKGINLSIPDDVIPVDESEYARITADGCFMPNREGEPIKSERRPSQYHTWDGSCWVIDEAGLKALEDEEQRQLVSDANAKKTVLMTEAAERIAPLQDASDLGIATNEELAQLKAWKTYRVLLSRVDTSIAPNIEWPLKP